MHYKNKLTNERSSFYYSSPRNNVKILIKFEALCYIAPNETEADAPPSKPERESFKKKL